MWPIPFEAFSYKAVATMTAEGCDVKKTISDVLPQVSIFKDQQDDFVKAAAKKHGAKPPTSNYLHSLSTKRGDEGIAVAVWYELHCSTGSKHLAERIDRKAFGGLTFEEAFPKDCADFYAAAGQWRLVGDTPLQAARELRWSFDLIDRQPGADGKSIGVYLEAAAGLEELGDNMFGFRKLHVKPRLAGSAADIEISQTLRAPQPAGEEAEVSLGGSGRAAPFWTVASTTSAPLDGFFTTDQTVMTIDPTSEPFAFTAGMIAESRDVCDQFGNEVPRDAKDAFLQALFTKEVGERDEKTDSIVLFEMKYAVRRTSKSSV